MLFFFIGTYDANYGGNGFDEKPQLSANFYLCGSAQSWKSCKAKIHCTSTAEAELCAAHLCSQLAIFAIKILNELRFTQQPVVCFGDNQSCTKILSRKHPSRAQRHFRVRANHIQGCVEDELLTFQDIPSALNPSDTGSKAILSPDMWNYLAALQQGKIRLGTPRSDFTTAALRDLMETHSYQNCGSYSVIAPSNASAQLKAPNETLTAKSRFGKTARVRSSTSDALANHRDIASRNSSARSTPCACSATASPGHCDALSLWRMGEL